MAQGLQHIPLGRSIPQQWDAAWFAKFIREVLALADVRNAIEGAGITISGQPGEVATISTSADVQALLQQAYVTAEYSAFLPNERKLSGENGVVSITDGGAGAPITIGIYDGGIPYAKLNNIDELSVLGNPTPDYGPLVPIGGTAEHDVLSVQLNGSDLEVRFGTITHQSVSDFDEAAQDAVGGILADSDTVAFTYDDGTPAITADVVTQMSIDADASGLKLSGDSATPGNNKVYGTDGTGVKGWYSGGGGGGNFTFVGSATVSGAAATDLTISGLDLDTDGCYYVSFEIKNGSVSTANIALLYNADTTATNYDTQQSNFSGTGNSNARGNNANLYGVTTGKTASSYFYLRKNFDGQPRAVVTSTLSDTTTIQTHITSHSWRTSGTNVTGITILSSVASALSIGSVIRVWKVTT